MFKENNSNFFSTTDLDLEEMLRVTKKHKAMLDRIETELQDDLEQLNAILEFLQIIKDAESVELDEMLDEAVVEFKIHKMLMNANEYADILDINDLSIDKKLTVELNFAIHCIFDALLDEVSHYVDNDAETASQILKFLLDCR